MEFWLEIFFFFFKKKCGQAVKKEVGIWLRGLCGPRSKPRRVPMEARRLLMSTKAFS